MVVVVGRWVDRWSLVVVVVVVFVVDGKRGFLAPFFAGFALGECDLPDTSSKNST
jgi:hypothetical protein